ncbi:MAG: PHP domain-containing protein [Planctomycetota bacterium]
MRHSRFLISCAAALPLVALAFAEPVREPRWWRGNLHTHSLWSDGNDFPEMVVDWYRARPEYQFLALTEHNVLADHEKWVENDLVVRRGGRTALREYRDRFGEDWVETREAEGGKLEVRLKTLPEFRGRFEVPGEFLLIDAEEITDSYGGLPIHINATNVGELVRPKGGTSVRDVIQQNLEAVKAQAEKLERPILAHVNHPNFGWAVTAEDLAYAPAERFFEVYNGHPGVRQLGDDVHASIERAWDVANALRIQELGAEPLFGLATDDSHNYHNASASIPGRGWVVVRSSELTAESLIGAMEAGDFYASSGVGLRDVRFADGALHVEVDPVDGETYRIDFIGTRAGLDLSGEKVQGPDGAVLHVTRRYPAGVGATLHSAVGHEARYELTGDELYVRAVVTSSASPDRPVWEGQRKQAWTQPVGWRARSR